MRVPDLPRPSGRILGVSAFVGLAVGAIVGIVLYSSAPFAASIRAGRPGGLAPMPSQPSQGKVEPSAMLEELVRLCREDDVARLFVLDHPTQASLSFEIRPQLSADPVKFMEAVGPRVRRLIEATRREFESRLAAGLYLPCYLFTLSARWRVERFANFKGIDGEHVLVWAVPAAPWVVPLGGARDKFRPSLIIEFVQIEGGRWRYRDVAGVVPQLDGRFTLAWGRAAVIPGQDQPLEVHAVHSGISVPASPGSRESRLSSSPFMLKVVPPIEQRAEIMRILGFARGEYPSRWLKVALTDGTVGYVEAGRVHVDRVQNDEGAFVLIGRELLAEWEGMVEAPLQEIPIFERFLQQYPQSRFGADARIEIARRYAAAATFARLPSNAGKHDWKPYAEKAIAVYDEVLEKYPNSRAAVLAEIGVAEVRYQNR